MKARHPSHSRPSSLLVLRASFLCASFVTLGLHAQNAPPPPPVPIPPHDISGVDTITPDGAMATPLPVKQQKRLKRYDLPELAGSRQAIGSQLIDGRLPRPLVDYVESPGGVHERVPPFRGGLGLLGLTSPSGAP